MSSRTSILVVDDNEDILYATVRLLNAVGSYHIIEARNGEDCLSLVKEQRPDIVLLDAELPDIHGFQICRQLKEDSSFGSPLVIMVSGVRISGEDRKAGLAALADGYILRPFDNDEFLAQLEAYARIKKSEKALRESESRNRTILNAVPDLLFVFNGNGVFLDFHAVGAEPLLFASPGDFLGKGLSEVFPEAFASTVLEFIGKALATGEIQRYEYQLPIEGRTWHFESRFVSSGEDKVLCIIRDITNRKQAEEALAVSEERYKDLVEKAGIAIGADDEEGNLAYFNEALCELFGYTAEEIRELAHHNLLHPDDREKVASYHNQRINGGEVPSRYEVRGVRKDGSVINLEVAISKMLESEGKIIGTKAYMWDITERKKAQEALEESEGKYRNLVERAKDGIYILQDRRFAYVNQAFCEIFGYSEEELMALDTFLELVAEESLPSVRKRAEQLEQGEAISPHYEFTGLTKGRELRYIDASIVTIHYQGKLARQGIIRDVTSEKLHGKQMQNLITNTSHLINTPLTVALGQMDMVSLGLKEMTPELAGQIRKKLEEIKVLVKDELGRNIALLTNETSDGWTPVANGNGN